MDPFIEVVFPDSQQQILQDRFEMPLFFILGGADDAYLSSLIGQDIEQIVRQKSVDPIPELKPFGVYASRSLLSSTGYARTFSLGVFLNKEWPILLDITGIFGDEPNFGEFTQERNKSAKIPDQIEIVWIIRALRRIEESFPGLGYDNMAEIIRTQLLESIYPEKLPANKIPTQLNVNALSALYLELSEKQKEYPLVVIIDDLPIQLDKTLGRALTEISLTQCTTANLRAIRTSLDLISM